MIIAIYATKGGQGVTTIAAGLAIIAARRGNKTLLVDTGTDLPDVLGLTIHTKPGLTEYLTDNRVSLADITTHVTDRLDLIARGDHQRTPDAFTYGLLTGGLDRYDTVIIDAGTNAPEWARHADTRILVTRPCYLALRHATNTSLPRRPDHVIVINEPGRALHTTDIEAAIGAPVIAVIDTDPAIARAVDAGTLATAMPRSLVRALMPVVAAIVGARS